MRSPNPTGRPKGARGLAEYISERTGDGKELVDRLLNLSRRMEAYPKRSIEATMALLDRLVGKPLQSTQVHALVETSDGPPANWDSLSPAERRQIIAQRRAALGPAAQLALASASGSEDDE